MSLKNNKNSNEDEDDTISRTNDLLKTAARLRKEAEALEQSMRSRNISSSSAAGGGGGGKTKQGTDVDLSTTVAANQQDDTLPSNNSMKNKFYTCLKDSTWMISYRFASDAVNRDNSNDNDSSSPKPTFYSGKVKVTFQADGYTTMLETPPPPPPPPQDSTHEAAAKINSSSNVLKFQKFWGWDEETSRDDGMQYLLFSADVLLPESDPNYSKMMAKQRFYFQCRVNNDSKTGEISMSDGTVTIKKDIEPPGGFWGVFNGGGILAQFRYCGNFLMKPWSK
eukprot:CAMPEP_0176477968 /NCGR_PEP_ID=MMETSP0200_2-20121128/927_1 /TAXON_ID=947934 /ORGANISM="Chaetoceros sp., Strain GSL56" /LENGTH=279 /DNA_ID=CAMNT_0017873857 /DNA_START=150 /DNA_END=989 /DNA_ORIENTATION=-